jgi:hypothetical protein
MMGCGIEVESPQLARTCNEKPEQWLNYVLLLTAQTIKIILQQLQNQCGKVNSCNMTA